MREDWWRFIFDYIPKSAFKEWALSVTKGSTIPDIPMKRMFHEKILKQLFPKALYEQVNIVDLPVVKIPSIPREYVDYVGKSYIKGNMSRFQDMYGRQGIIARRKNGGHFVVFQRYSDDNKCWAVCFYDLKNAMVDARRFRYESGETLESLCNESWTYIDEQSEKQINSNK